MINTAPMIKTGRRSIRENETAEESETDKQRETQLQERKREIKKQK